MPGWEREGETGNNGEHLAKEMGLRMGYADILTEVECRGRMKS